MTKTIVINKIIDRKKVKLTMSVSNNWAEHYNRREILVLALNTKLVKMN